MKHIQRLIATVVLTMALAFPAVAGDILGPGVVEPPPPPSATVTGDMPLPGATGDIPAPGITGDMPAPGVTAIDPGTDIFLSLLQSVLSLF